MTAARIAAVAVLAAAGMGSGATALTKYSRHSSFSELGAAPSGTWDEKLKLDDAKTIRPLRRQMPPPKVWRFRTKPGSPFVFNHEIGGL